MKYSKLGITNLEVSRICLGTMTWGMQNTESEGHEQMDYALDQGVNFWDTAELYSVPVSEETQGRTEEIIGTWFQKTGKREDVILASKMAGPGVGWIRGGEGIKPDTVRQAIEGSLKRLQTDYIDLYQLHWAQRGSYHFQGFWGYEPPKVDREDEIDYFTSVLEALDEMVQEGKIRHVGLSNETAWGTTQYLKIAEEKGLPRMQSIQNEYSLLKRHFDVDLSEIAIHEQIGLLAWSPLACGLLSGKYLNDQVQEGTREAIAQNKLTGRINDLSLKAVQAYVDVATKHGLDVCQMALAFTLSKPFTTSTIIGATTMDQLKNNIASVDLELSDAVLNDIETVYRQYPIVF